MMKNIELEWKGRKYHLNEDEAFEVGERIEDIIPLTELAGMAERPNFHRIARCYAELLAHAGAPVSGKEVYHAMMQGMKGADDETQLGLVTGAIGQLIAILMDGAPDDIASVDDKKKPARMKKAS